MQNIFFSTFAAQIKSIMKTTKQTISAILASCLMWYGLLAVTACTEQAEYTVAQSDIPIYFSVSMNTLTEHPVSRTTATSFEPQDQIGLFATLPPTTLNDQRYIDNLLLTTTDGKNFSPAQIVYYPEGDASLNFTAYHPYQANGLPAESSILPVSIQADQSTSENFSKSDFLWTQKNGVNSSSEAVQLNFAHKFSKLKIALVPEAEEDLTALAEDQPRIVVAGIKTEANCNLTDGTLSNLQTPSDIIPHGTWTVEENKLVGKELIFIPQALHSQEQSIIIEWKGRVYVYLMPDVELQEAEQCEITIEFQKEENEQLTGIAGSITDWTDAEIGGNSNEQNHSVIYTSSLSFVSSNIYQIYYEGRAIAEICKEYLISDLLTSRAIVHYPIVSQTGKADLKNGTVLRLLDVEDAICGGKLCWETDGNGFSYENGNQQMVSKFYVGEDGSFLANESLNAANVDIISCLIRDIRGKEIIEYPVVKVGKQYWMQEDLRTIYYQDGTALTSKIELGEGAGYFHPTDTDIYFYNGEAVLAGELAPKGWEIPTKTDWEVLNDYIGGDVSLIKTGDWAPVEGEQAAPATNLTGLSIRSLGAWANGKHSNIGQVNSYWCMDETGTSIPDSVVLFRGELNKYSPSSSTMSQGYYKALSIRCIKE